MSDTVRTTGFENDVTAVEALTPQVIADATPVLSAAIDARTYARQRCLLIASYNEVTATAHTMTFTVTESATSGGSYTAATTTGSLTATSADAIQFAAVRVNPAMPFIKVTATGSHADVDGIVSAHLLFIEDTV